MNRFLGGFGYGLVRQPVSNFARQIPVIGGLGDEIAMLAVTGFASTQLSGIPKKIADAGFIIEASRLGSESDILSKLTGALGGSAPETQTATAQGATFA